MLAVMPAVPAVPKVHTAPPPGIDKLPVVSKTHCFSNGSAPILAFSVILPYDPT